MSVSNTSSTGTGIARALSRAPAISRTERVAAKLAAEALEGLEANTGIALTTAESRRNVLTRGIDVNALVGKRFRIGDVECRGVELCEPCSHLEGVTYPGVLKGLVHRAGLNADILTDGEIAVGDPIRVEP